ncbi:hypothetical protein [Rothia aerolata]|uniref:Uncharacterized protein n=1 Tax=Rothia aerolata TaxID=1812262 RepID=A0A917MUT1_9MICC|nr:hypothetical protein [Rothia aerolata]GGH65116.1 hypothetical protein GCM10007359_18040 [Rothia aerolata]
MASDVLLFKGKGQNEEVLDRATAKLIGRLEKSLLSFQIVKQKGINSQITSELNSSIDRYSPRVVLCIGYSANVFLSKSFTLNIPFVAVLPDIPGDYSTVYKSALRNLEGIAAVADLVMVLDEPSRSILEYLVAGMSGRVRLIKQVQALEDLVEESRNLTGVNQKILISSHDFRFIADTVHMFQRLPGVEVRLQEWPLASATPPENIQSDITWADTILCEWAGRNAVWYSHHLSSDKRLFIRLHGFESKSEWINNLNMDSVEKVLTVSAFYKNQLLARHGWESSQIEVIGNSINHGSFYRKKTSSAEFHLGMLGFTPLLKRPQVAVEILRLLVKKDTRFTLHLRGENPWNHTWLWQQNIAEVDAYRDLYSLVSNDDILRSHVVFESPGANVEGWFSKIGWILSLSERETFHLAAAEGMASGAVPVFLPREGIEEIFTDRWLFDSPQEIANYIYSTVTNRTWIVESHRASQYAYRFDFAQVSTRWRQEVLGD